MDKNPLTPFPFARSTPVLDRDPANADQEPQALADWELMLVGGGEDQPTWP